MVPHNLSDVVPAIDSLITASTGHLVVRLGLDLTTGNLVNLFRGVFRGIGRHPEFEVYSLN